ncbi:hypothetical protein Tco_0225240, partial [Tanacetum coccineum]
MAVALFRSPLRWEYHGNNRIGGAKAVGRRRVFVQTELESLLTFGDMVLNNDLSVVRNDSPLLLTRNVLHRSSSTP